MFQMSRLKHICWVEWIDWKYFLSKMSRLKHICWVKWAAWKVYLESYLKLGKCIFLNEQLLSCDKKYRDIRYLLMMMKFSVTRTQPMATRQHQQHQFRAETWPMLPLTTTITVFHLLLNWMPWMLNSTILLNLCTHRSANLFSFNYTTWISSKMISNILNLRSFKSWILLIWSSH